MKTSLLIRILIATTAFLTACKADAAPNTELLEMIRSTAVRVSGDRPGYPGNLGSGNVISCHDDYIDVLTAAHVIVACEAEIKGKHVTRKPCTWKIEQGQGQEVSHTLIGAAYRIDMARDIAIVRASRVESTSALWQCVEAPIAKNMPFIYSEVYVIAAPEGFMGTLGIETISSLNYIVHGLVRYQIIGLSAPGMSGGGIFNANGEIVGQVNMVLNMDGHLVPTVGWAVRLQEIKEFLGIK